MFKISQVVRGVMLANFTIMLNGMILTNDTGKLKKSNDWGANFSNVP